MIQGRVKSHRNSLFNTRTYPKHHHKIFGLEKSILVQYISGIRRLLFYSCWVFSHITLTCFFIYPWCGFSALSTVHQSILERAEQCRRSRRRSRRRRRRRCRFGRILHLDAAAPGARVTVQYTRQQWRCRIEPTLSWGCINVLHFIFSLHRGE